MDTTDSQESLTELEAEQLADLVQNTSGMPQLKPSLEVRYLRHFLEQFHHPNQTAILYSLLCTIIFSVSDWFILPGELFLQNLFPRALMISSLLACYVISSRQSLKRFFQPSIILGVVLSQLLITLMARNAAAYEMYHFQIVLLMTPLIFLTVFRVNSRFVLYAQAIMMTAPLAMMTLHYNLSRPDLTANVLSYASVGLFALYINYSLNLQNKRSFIYALLNQHKQAKLELAQTEMEYLSKTDPLTQVANRRHLQDTLINEWKSSIRTNRPISIIMIDIDHFKKFNDSYGHIRGDQCLIQVCDAIKQSASRPRDLVARFGGEEFMLVLPEADQQSATNVGAKVVQAIQKLEIQHCGAGETNIVTVSVGIATTQPVHNQSLDDFVKLADDALYTAKSKGRNCSVTAGKPDDTELLRTA